jgi:hypothetical protein
MWRGTNRIDRDIMRQMRFAYTDNGEGREQERKLRKLTGILRFWEYQRCKKKCS